jgi:hypothetical protein
MGRPRVTSNKAFNRSRRVHKGAGPVYIYTKDLPNQKTKQGGSVKGRSGCDGPIDNNVTYVYDIGTNGNHTSYVDCDYVG